MQNRFASKTFSIQRICDCFGMSRPGYYKHLNRSEKKHLVEQVIVEMVLEERKQMPREGGKKLYRRLKPRLNQLPVRIGRDKFYNILKSNGLLVRKRKKYVKTTNSKHRFRVYENLIKDYEPSRPNSLWVSDITYLRVGKGFMYLALITDAYSRKIVGYDVSDSLELRGCLRALNKAIRQRNGSKDLIHHSDRGIQYCSKAYTQLLEKNDIQISMAAQGNCYENAMAERMNGILKVEFLLDQHFQNKRIAKQAVKQAIKLYNERRLHMSIAYLTPQVKHAA